MECKKEGDKQSEENVPEDRVLTIAGRLKRSPIRSLCRCRESDRMRVSDVACAAPPRSTDHKKITLVFLVPQQAKEKTALQREIDRLTGEYT